MNEKEQAFWDFIQEFAKLQNAAFYMDCGEGHDINTDQYEGEDYSGWLIPQDQEEIFREYWENGTEDDDRWDEFYCFAEWSENEGQIKIEFKKYTIYS
jgi:hypothetical protein